MRGFLQRYAAGVTFMFAARGSSDYSELESWEFRKGKVAPF
jgi:hypothetical protein